MTLFTNTMDDSEKIKQAYSLIGQVNDKVMKLFTVGWNWIPGRISMGDRGMIEQLLKNYDYESVRDAFLEARAQNKETIAYVRVVAKNIYEKKAVKKNTEEHQQIKKEEQTPYNFANDPDWQKLKNKMSIK